MLDCAAHVGLALATASSWLGLGALLLRPLADSGDRALDVCNRLGVGALGFAFLTFIAGWAGLLHWVAYWPVLVGFGALGVREVLRLRPIGPDFSSWPRWHLALAMLLALYVVIDVVATCAPVSSADALLHHAAAPELFEQRHRIVEVPWSWNSYQPYTVEMLVTDGFLAWDSVQGAFAPLLLGLAGTAAVGFGTARLAGRGAGLLAAAIVLCQPFTVWMTTSTFVEPGLVLMVALALWNLVWFARSSATEAAALAGLFAGGAAAMKYPAAAGAALLAVAAGLFFRHRLTLRSVIAFTVPALAVALPWYVKNAILTGNPIYPFVFGAANDEALQSARDSFEHYGYGKSLADLLVLPLRLLGDADAFDRGEFVTPLPLLFAPLVFLVPRARRLGAYVWAAGVVFALAWFVGSQHSRFLMPLLPAFAALGSVGVLALASAGRVGRVLSITVTIGAFASGFAISVAYVSQFVPVVVGAQTEREFLLEKTSYYAATDWMNQNLPADAVVALDYLFALPVERPAIVWTADVLETTAGPDETRAFIRRFGITHAAVFAEGERRRDQLAAVGAREIARVNVRPVVSRTLSELGPSQPMLIYELRR